MAKVAILLAPGFDDVEYAVPAGELARAGHRVVVAGHCPGETLRGRGGEAEAVVGVALEDLEPDGYAALLITGNVSQGPEPDERAVGLVRRFCGGTRLVGAFGGGPRLLLQAGVLIGRRVTSAPGMRGEFERAGARWRDAAVVIDGNLVTSRGRADLEPYVAALRTGLRDRQASVAAREDLHLAPLA